MSTGIFSINGAICVSWYARKAAFSEKASDMEIQALDAHDNLVGVVISKLEPHRGGPLRGYIAMLAVKEEHRGKGIATKLVRLAIDIMIEREADEVRVH